ncbi:HesA/MoeB/ThiF family protein [Desulfurococcus mucosus]|uniref:UBA/THIF-type NAD/FAD binding protein n=1 Tax=Desulfurococcus mucosus (strain ATCC 35584 / DSM 2162 / JCM 9187 / O7/1) TaxID=765177 RepID=E8RA53_DESM0|nr:HesA/MoeB/ThiF family protein [Desulfurococcus mucosus]ADV64331.1 UBA/THIF-type NAD/FAD binding protein [Desulfurococcus mucosus DSM 2162]
MALSEEELERYSRQLPIIGVEGQAKLKNTSILVAGAGGLGSAVLYYLTAAGVGRIIFIDEGLVELSNLQRQILYTVDDIGRSKVTAAYERLRRLNPNVLLEPVQASITRELLDEVMQRVDIVVDALDNWETRFTLDEAAWRHGKPLVHAGVGEHYGQLTVVIPGKTPCLRYLFHGVRAREKGRVIVMPHIPGLLGLLEVNEVFKLILGYGDVMAGRILLFNAKAPSIEVIEVKCGDFEKHCGKPGAVVEGLSHPSQGLQA